MPDDLRTRFEATRGFPLDPFQQRALDAIDAGRHVLVAAPTGSGKTLVAEYAIEHALAAGGKAFYTTPLKALSNQKYGDLVRGARRGPGRPAHRRQLDQRRRPDRGDDHRGAPQHDLRGVARPRRARASVVLDEVHYLQDRYRGPVWEEVIVHLDPAVGLVCLSATVSNAEEVATWIETVRGPTAAVIEEHRPVTLRAPLPGGGAGSRRAPPAPDVQPRHGQLRPQPRGGRLDARRGAPPGTRGARPPAHVAPDAEPRRDGRAPRRGGHAPGDRVRVQPGRLRPGGAAVPRRRAPPHRSRRARADPRDRGGEDRLRSPTPTSRCSRYDSWLAGLEAGFAAHHAGHGAADEGGGRGGVRRRAWSRSCSRPRPSRSGSTCRRGRW